MIHGLYSKSCFSLDESLKQRTFCCGFWGNLYLKSSKASWILFQSLKQNSPFESIWWMSSSLLGRWGWWATLRGFPTPETPKPPQTWPGIGGHESSQLLFFRGAVGRFLFLWKGGWGKGSRNEIWNEPIYANILEVDLDLFGCIRDPWCPCETCSSQISHGVNVVSTRLCRKLNMHRRCWEKLGAWPRVAPSKKITLQSMDPTWCLPVNADPTWTCFLSFLPRQFLKEGDILKGYYLPGKIGN